MLNINIVSDILNKKGFNLQHVDINNKWNAKVRRVELGNHQPAMLKIWPFYPLRFSKIELSREWVNRHLADCRRPFNELGVNRFIKENSNLVTPDIYMFETVLPFKSMKCGAVMLLEDLCLKGYRDFKEVMARLIRENDYQTVFRLMAEIARAVETLFKMNVFSDDYYFDNFLVNDENQIALIDFERSFICHDQRKLRENKRITVEVMVKSYKRLTNEKKAFDRGLAPLYALLD